MWAFNMLDKRIVFSLLIALAVMIAMCIDQCNRKNKALSETEAHARGDGLIKKIDDLGREQTKTYGEIQSYKELLDSLNIKIKNSDLKQPGSSITYISSYTPFKYVSKPFVIHDAITNEPTFFDTIKGFDKWITGDVRINKDTSIIHISVANDYIVTLGYEKKHWFSLKGSIPYATVYNLNPYTVNNDVRIYRVHAPKRARFGLGFGVTYGITNELKVGAVVGITASYNLINF